MLAAYLVLNAVLYALFALLTSIAPARIAAALGFSLDASGRIEFLTVYGGLELGVALYYAWSVYAGPATQRAALMFSLCLYAGLVLFRLAGLFLYGPASPTILIVAGLEMLLLLAAVGLTLKPA